MVAAVVVTKKVLVKPGTSVPATLGAEAGVSGAQEFRASLSNIETLSQTLAVKLNCLPTHKPQRKNIM